MKIQKWSKKEFWLCGLLMCMGVLAFHAFYFNSVLPVSEGWGIYYVELLKRGQIPYRDFYYYLPPLNLLIDWLFWSLSFGNMLVFRGWYLLQRIFMVALLYKLLTKWFPPRYAWLACLTGACLGAASEYDLVGDYNQTQSLLIIVLSYVIVLFLEKDADSHKKGFAKYKYIFVAGVLLSIMLLLKQSLGLAAAIVCFLFLVAYCVVFHDKKFGWYCLSTAIGVVIPLAICLVFLLANQAFFPFLEQFFGAAGAKGGIATIIFAGISNTLINWSYIGIYFSLLMCVVSLRSVLKNKTPEAILTMLASCFVLVASVISLLGGAINRIKEFVLTSTTLTVAIVGILAVVLICLFLNKRRSLPVISKMNYLLPTSALFALAFFAVFFDVKGAFSSLYYNTTLFNDLTTLINYMACYTMLVGLVYCFISYGLSGNLPCPKPVIALFVCGFMDFYTCSMASGGYPIPRMMFTIVPVFLVCAFSFELPRFKWNSAKNLCICVLCVIACGVCMMQKYIGAYSWWGSNTMYELNERMESVEVEELRGFRLSAQKKLEYEEITRLIKENDDEDSTVWGFPYVKIFNILTDHYNTEDPVPVLFYDVCSDEAAIEESQWLEDNNPDFVIWCDIPDCLGTHERIFRNGEPLGQRKIVEWFNEVQAERYTCIGQVGNLFVYKLNDGSPINYTYFQDINAINSMA